MIPFAASRARALFGDQRGVAMIEFAYALPVVLLLGLGGMETANYALTHLRISQMAITVADNAARVNLRIDEAQVEEAFLGADLVADNLDFEENGRIVLSSLQANGQVAPNEGQMIHWQRCFGDLAVAPAYGLEDKGRTDATLPAMGPAGRQISALPNTAIMFAEVSYRYRPLIGASFGGIEAGTIIRYESAFNVRGRTNQDITNTGARTVRTC